NWEPFPIRPERLDAVFITHAHIDHTGYLPRLVAQGFDGPVYASEATCALLELLLPDSAYLQEQDAAYANKTGYSRHKPALPLYSVEDAEAALELLQPVAPEQSHAFDGLEATWFPAGHILGSSILQLDIRASGNQRRAVFSGDLGGYRGPFMAEPTPINAADILFVESTYGDRLHADQKPEAKLEELIRRVWDREGVLLIPSFAVGRTQQVLYLIRQLQEAGKAPDIPVYIDSPMAVDASHLYCDFGDDHNLEISLLMDQERCPLRCQDTSFVKEVQDSKALNRRPGPAIIISASGMATGGRILHHLKWRLPDKRNSVLFIGYQAEGTRGRRLLEGAKNIRIHGQEIAVSAEIVQIDGLSAHADQAELLRWLAGFKVAPQRALIVHGEPHASQALRSQLANDHGWSASMPQIGESIIIR
ncbi:MAG: MBL fold metallo-hydrolase RNA specificity domain-containing protein, partial [Anaerolineales bacterium]